MEGSQDTQISEIRENLANVIRDYSVHLSEASRRQDIVISNLSDELCELKATIKQLQLGGNSNRNQEPGLRATRSIKLNLARFTGDDPQEWLFQAEEYFAFHRVAEEAKLQIAGFHMFKAALAWIRGLLQNGLLSTWAIFCDDLLERFGILAFDDKLEELSRLQQSTSVAEYMAQFEQLMNDVEGQSEETLINFFIGGLKSEIRNQLKISRPSTLRTAFATAKIFES